MIYGKSLQISTERNDNDILYIRTAGRSLLCFMLRRATPEPSVLVLYKDKKPT